MTMQKFVRHDLLHTPPRTILELPAESLPYSVDASGRYPHVYTLEPATPHDMKRFVFYALPVDRAVNIPPTFRFIGIAGAVAYHIYWATDE